MCGSRRVLPALYGEPVARGFLGKMQTVLGLAGLVALGVTASLVSGVNPLEYADEASITVRDELSGALEKLRGDLSKPPPQWAERVDGLPVAAAVTANHVVVVLRGAVEARRLSDGGRAWTRTVDWAVPVNGAVVAGRAAGGGFEVLEPATGKVRWLDSRAEAAWPYADVVLSSSCPRDRCAVMARSIVDGRVRWRRVLGGPADRLAGYQELDDAVDHAGLLHPDYPGPLPRLVGVVVNRRITVLDTRSGAVVGRHAPNVHTQVMVTDGRVLSLAARPVSDGGCRYLVRGGQPSGRQVWQRAGYDPGTVSGSGCEQRSDPVVAGGVLVAVAPDGRPALIGIRSGEIRWTGAPRDTLLAVAGRVAVVRVAKTGRLSALDPRTGRKLWDRAAHRRAHVVATDHAVLISESEAGTITAVSPDGGGVLGLWRSQATPVGVDRAGLVLASGRTVGYLAW